MVKQLGRVARNTTRQDLRFPSRRRNFVTLKLAKNLQRAIDPVQLRARRQVLPAKQETHEIGCRNGFNLAPQSSECEAVNASQQAPVAPLGFVRSLIGPKAAAQNLALGFELREPDIDKLAPEHQALGQFGEGRGTSRFQPAAQNFGYRRLPFVTGAEVSQMRQTCALRRRPEDRLA